MSTHREPKTSVDPEQITYANLLFWGSWIGMFILVITFLIYVSGILSPYVPVEKITQVWSLRVTDYLHELNCPTGWAWITKCGYGDYLNFIGVAILAGLTVLCFLTLIPAYARKKDLAYLIIVIVEILVLAFAASGILAVGGH